MQFVRTEHDTTMIMNGEYIRIWRMELAVCLKPLPRHFSGATEELIAGTLCETVTGNLPKNIIATVWKSKVQYRSFN